jgi:hypothetical protein
MTIVKAIAIASVFLYRCIYGEYLESSRYSYLANP